MSNSILAFAREFEKLKTELAQLLAGDARILLMTAFFSREQERLLAAGYESYLGEYSRGLVREFQSLSKTELENLSLTELGGMAEVLEALVGSHAEDNAKSDLRELLRTTLLTRSRIMFWVGETRQALTEAVTAFGVKVDETFDHALKSDLSPFEAVQYLYRSLGSEHPELQAHLLDVISDWGTVRDSLTQDNINCLLVDRSTGAPRGQLMPLKAVVDSIDSRDGNGQQDDAAGDQVVINNRTVSPTDSYVGSTYTALAAVRHVLKPEGGSLIKNKDFRAFLSMDAGQRAITGGSTGLPIALVTFTQLLKSEVARHERFIGGDMAVTGGIADDGKITQVNPDTLRAKVERAFFSPLRVLVVPEENEIDAKAMLEQLSKAYPNRRIRLISASSLWELIENRDVIRSERVCMGQYMVRTAYRYTRATKVQVPVLLLLGYLLLCLLYPRAWPWFDDNPAYGEMTETGFLVRNEGGTELWSKDFECKLYTGTNPAYPYFTVLDVDNDSKSEVFFIPWCYLVDDSGAINTMYLYDYKGNPVSRCFTPMLYEYPVDSLPEYRYDQAPLTTLNLASGRIFRTIAFAENPSRQHHKYWSARGELLGWYIHSGYTGAEYIVRGDVLIQLGVANRLGRRLAISAISPRTVAGVSPPYRRYPDLDLTSVRRAEHVAYVVLPQSDVGVAKGAECVYPDGIKMLTTDSIEIKTASFKESDRSKATICYFMNEIFRVTHASLADGFREQRDLLVRDGRLEPVDYDEYVEDLERAVEYWTGDGWITEGQIRDLEHKLQKSILRIP